MLTDAVDDMLSKQLRGAFGFNAAVVSLGMAGSIVFSLVVAACMVAHQLVVAARLPLLKLSSTAHPPDLTLEPTHRWHLFLCAEPNTSPPPHTRRRVHPVTIALRRSHIWGTAQGVPGFCLNRSPEGHLLRFAAQCSAARRPIPTTFSPAPRSSRHHQAAVDVAHAQRFNL